MCTKQIFKIILILLLIPIAAAFAPLTSSASSDTSSLEDIEQRIRSQLERSADDDTEKVIGDIEIDLSSNESIAGSAVSKILSGIIRRFCSDLSKPVSMLGKLIAAILLCALAQGMSPSSSEMTDMYKTVSILIGLLVMYDCINESITTVISALDRLSAFMISYIPIFASVTAASGNYTSAAGFYGSNLFLCECTAFLAQKALLPLLSVLTAFSIAACINKDIKLGSAVSSVRTAIRWGMGIMMTVFAGMLTIQTAIGSAADSVKTRTVRFAATSFIPIIGSAVSESYSAIKGSLHIIRTGTGAVGAILIAATVLYPIITVLAVRAVLAAVKFVSDIFAQDNMSAMLKSMNDILAIGMSILICISMMFIISTAIIMLTVSNTGA